MEDKFPIEVVGMILVDSAHPEQEEHLPPTPVKLEPSPIDLWLNRQLARIGVLRLLQHLPRYSTRIPLEMLPKLKAFAPQSICAVQAETKMLRRNLHRAKGTNFLRDIPLVVLTAAKPIPLRQQQLPFIPPKPMSRIILF
ncbi:MAG: hypothetical protein QNJ51_26355 [Calothrix sp. MO_167.B12]|nr:hypothetical protein [Calothrix sp. MO_167.B12]